MLRSLLPYLAVLNAVTLRGAAAVIRSNDAIFSRDNCTNTDSRLCWDGTYDITTDYYTSGPRTGKVVQYNLEISNGTAAPEGVSRQVLYINGQIPGPTIVADWGDTIEVTVTNAMTNNGTSIHWHGIRQLNNFLNDGVNGVTECPLAPGDSKTYTFVAEQYGTSWYHSHFSAQYGDGVFGAIQINGPATAEYDIDLGTVTLNEWFNDQTAYQVASEQELGSFQTANNFLVNGTNVNFDDDTLGERFKFNFTAGKKHRIRFINTAVDNFFRISFDNHTMSVIQTDFVPIQPYTAETLAIAIGQRYDVIVEANQTSGSYWFRTWVQSCDTNSNDGTGTANAYVLYSDADDALPTSPSSTPYTNADTCLDEDASNLVPYVTIDIDSSGWSGNETYLEVEVNRATDSTGASVFRWSIGGAEPMSVDYANPTALQLADGTSIDSLDASLRALSVGGAGAETVYWLIQASNAVAHPIHLHLHDFNIVSSGSGTFDADTATYNWDNPPRRDVATLPASGYLLLVFKADNPGIAIMHCHIAWHVSEGLSLELIERESEIDWTQIEGDWTDTCTNWSAYANSTADYWGAPTDSGLRRRGRFTSRLEAGLRR